MDVYVVVRDVDGVAVGVFLGGGEGMGHDTPRMVEEDLEPRSTPTDTQATATRTKLTTILKKLLLRWPQFSRQYTLTPDSRPFLDDAWSEGSRTIEGKPFCR